MIAFFSFDLLRHGTGDLYVPGGHVILFCEFESQPPISLSLPLSKLSSSFKNYSANSVLSALSSCDFSPLYSSSDLSSFVDILSAFILRSLDSVAPLSSFLYTPVRAIKEPWRTSEFVRLEKLATQSYKKNGRSENTTPLLIFRDLRSRSSDLYTHLPHSYLRDSIAGCHSQTDLRKVLDKLGLRGGRSPPNSCSPSDYALFLVDLPGGPDSDPDLHSQCDNASAGPYLSHFRNVTTEDIVREVLARSGGRSVGPDGIHMRQLLDGLPILASILSDLFNSILSSGSYPVLWKKTLVKPIPKALNPTSCSHYRPITLQSNLAKIFEGILLAQMSSYL